MKKFTSISLALLAVLASTAALAQNALQIPSPNGARPPGLYVAVLDGLIKVTNPAGTTNFAAGQFGYTASVNQPPVPLPKNPALPFTLPPAFNTSTSVAGSSAPKSNTVDCVVR